MSLVFYITLLVSIIVFTNFRNTKFSIPFAFGLSILLSGGLLYMHGAATIKDSIDAIWPFVPEAIAAELLVFFCFKFVKKKLAIAKNRGKSR